jgi:acetate---CoA ligase (ADP-forming)
MVTIGSSEEIARQILALYFEPDRGVFPKQARRALEGLKGAKIFTGVRGAPPADLDALADMAARLSWLADDLRDQIAELDLNPVVVLPEGQGACAVDALLVTR